jgi:hypothetical protein
LKCVFHKIQGRADIRQLFPEDIIPIVTNSRALNAEQSRPEAQAADQ